MTKKPKIRFQGFQDDWELRKLDNVAKFSKGNGYSKGDLVDEGIPIVLYGRLYTNYETTIKEVDTFVVEKENSVFTKGGEVVIPASGETAEDIARASAIENAGILLGGDLNIINPEKNINSSFLALSISNGNAQKELAKKAQGKSVVHIRNDEIKKLVISFPNRSEQDKISDYFTIFDNLITLHQRKCEEIKTLKKYMLQNMFPQDGEKTPKIRFDGFTGDWEQRKLTEFVKFFSGLTYTPHDVQDTGTLVLRSSNVYNGEVVDADNVYVNSSVVNSENVQEGDIIIVVRNGSRSLIGKHAQIKRFMPNTVIGAFMTGIRSQCPEFTNALLNTPHFDKEVALNMGATINQITGYMFSKINFFIPTIEEQKEIGLFFEKLDHLITLHQRKYEQLQSMKKFMLQNLFV